MKYHTASIKLLLLLPLWLLPLLLFSQNTAETPLQALQGTAPVTVRVADTLVVRQAAEKEPAPPVDGTQPPDLGQIFSFWKIFWALIFLAAGFFLIRIITGLLELWAERSTTRRITVKGVVPVVRIVGWMLLFTIIIGGIFQPPAATLLALWASVGIAVGFAAQDVLKNIFGGITILLDRPFQVGDKIEIGPHYGEVVEIGLRSTRIVTPDDSLVTVPNSELMNQSVSNSNAGEANCQVVAELYLPLGVDTARVRQLAYEAAHVSRFIYQNKPVTVLFFNELKNNRSWLKMRLKAYVMDIRYEFTFKSEMTEIVLRELIKEGLVEFDEKGIMRID
ncbi:mechanosensitive ion channel family protein [Cesiribacter sp. SM1]|uniref:mechanosensitive ion channel family protein n=1 Tax=Cesiribacter sp. SM1 TaxID=2861196 RepID=UPI001CD6E6B9|nr:mechanosensitive ion channel domain-containing protein [Cesiribacter sp. SM1]